MSKKTTKKIAKATMKKALTKENDLIDLRDIPQEVKDQLRSSRILTGLSGQVIELIRDYKTISINEILVVLYRRHKLIPRRTAVLGAIAYLHKKGEVDRLGGGEYKLS